MGLVESCAPRMGERCDICDERAQASLRRGMARVGARYTGDSFYGLVHETMHHIDLGTVDASFDAINEACMTRLTPHGRMIAEVVAHCAARRVCALVGFPTFANGAAYSAASVRKYALEHGEAPDWSEADFVAASAAAEDSAHVGRLVAALMELAR